MFAALRRNLFFGVFPDGVTQVQVIIADGLRIVHSRLAERRLLIERTTGDDARELLGVVVVKRVLKLASPGPENHESGPVGALAAVYLQPRGPDLQKTPQTEREPGAEGDLFERGAPKKTVKEAEEEEERQTKDVREVLHKRDRYANQCRRDKEHRGDSKLKPSAGSSDIVELSSP